MMPSDGEPGIEGEGGDAKVGNDRAVSSPDSSQQPADSDRHQASAAAGAERDESTAESPSDRKIDAQAVPHDKASEPGQSKQPRTHEERWEESFQRLVAFHKKHGHCNIPYRCDEDPFLGRWVSLQRSIYKAEATRVSGRGEAPSERPSKSSAAHSDRVRRLNELGFEWTPQETRQVSWEQRYSELCDFVVRTMKERSKGGFRLPGVIADGPWNTHDLFEPMMF